ncbi:MAG: class I SAM-dependent methyltransferase [Bacteroidetes bacterium]|nr:class I SAM-dependent methyltransferase [Bacteroidota bacterium]
MELTLFQTINYSLLIILGILFIRYLYIMYADSRINPVQWQNKIKRHEVSPRLKKLEKKYSDKVRFFNWWLQIERLKRDKVPGVFVELGVYQGESAEIIHQMDTNRDFHLFDTFTGFRASDLSVETGEAATYTPNHFADTSIKAVVERIGGQHLIKIHAGYFPESAFDFNEPVALVNIDADLYNPTRAGLEFFYQRLSPGGVILVHDYNIKWSGIIQAVDEFIPTIPESLVFIPDKYGTVMIIRNK